MDLLDEITADIKKEQQFKILIKMLPFILGITLIFIMIVSYQIWSNNKIQLHNAEMGDLIHNAIALSTTTDNKQIVNESYDYISLHAKNHIKDLAALNKALSLHETDKVARLKLLEEIIDQPSYSYIVRDYAKILWLSLNVDNQSDTSVNTKVSDKFLQFSEYFKSEDQLFFSSATLIKALWSIKNKQYDTAVQLLKKIINCQSSTISNKDYANKILANLQRIDYK